MDLVSYWQRHCAPYVRARLAASDVGASLVEYALLVGLIAIVCIAAISFLGGRTAVPYSRLGSGLQ